VNNVFYVEGRLRKAEKALVEKHLKECNYCLQKVIELKETEYLYSLSKRGLLKNFFTSVKKLFTHKKLILAFACIILLFSVLFVTVKQESLPVDPSSIVTVRATLVKRIVSVHKIFSQKFASIHIKQI